MEQTRIYDKRNNEGYKFLRFHGDNRSKDTLAQGAAYNVVIGN